MSDDDHKDSAKQANGYDGEKPTRDARGRWLPKYCPNPKGRPKKKRGPEIVTGQSDLQTFGDTAIEVVTNGQKKYMNRRTALLFKMFEQAMKGSVSAQRFIYKEFRKNDEALATIARKYEALIFDWYLDHPNRGKPDHEVPLEVEIERSRLEAFLHIYFPGMYPYHGPTASHDIHDDKEDRKTEPPIIDDILGQALVARTKRGPNRDRQRACDPAPAAS